MGLFGGSNVIKEAVKGPVNRLFTTAFEQMGAVTRKPDTRTKDELAKHMQETAKIVPDIAKETLNGGYTMDYSKQENFMEMIKTFVNPNAKPDKITVLFKDLAPAADKLSPNFNIYLYEQIC